MRYQEHLGEGRGHAWRVAYRIMCKHAPCVPEIFCSFAGLPMMKRSFAIMQLYAPVQGPRLDVERGNESEKMYGAYLRHYGPNVVMAYNFLGWCRRYRMVDGTARQRPDDPVEGVLGGRRLAVGVDFCFELLDRYMCQFFVMFFPHRRVDEFTVAEGEELGYMKYFVGGLKYLHGLRWLYQVASHSGAR